MDPVPLTRDEVEHFDEVLNYSCDTVVRCQTCGRTQFLKLQWGIENGWSECHGQIMPIIYHKLAREDEDIAVGKLRLDILRKYFYKKKE